MGVVYTTNTSPSFGSGTYTPNYSGVWQEVVSDYQTNIEKNIFQQSPLLDHLVKKENTVQQEINKVVAKRREKRIEKLVEHFAEQLDALEANSVISWTTKFKGNDTIYRYVAVNTDRQWFISNRTGGLDLEDLIGELTRQAMEGTVEGLYVHESAFG